jgi:ATP-dependent DNA helicase RecQ
MLIYIKGLGQMVMKELYEKSLNAIFSDLRKKNRKFIVFFKGFPAKFYESLDASAYFGLKENRYNNEQGYIDGKGLLEEKNNLMVKFLTASESGMWGYYEEFITLCESLVHIKDIFNGDIYIVNNNLFDKYYFLDLEQKVKEKLWSYFNQEENVIHTSIEAETKLFSNALKYNESDYVFSYINKHVDEGIKEIDFFPSNEILFSEMDSGYSPIFVNDHRFELLKNEIQNGKSIDKVNIAIEKEEDKRKVSAIYTIAASLSLPIIVSYNNKFSEIDSGDNEAYLHLLKKYWGEASEYRQLKFYENPEVTSELLEISQGQIVNDIIQQSVKALKNDETYRDIFITSPTGSGKSLLFQIPAIHLAEQLKAVTIVITPLIALMQDQVENLEKKHKINFATFINSDIPFQERERRIYGIKNEDYSIVYISPEFFLANTLSAIIGERQIGLLVIDEAHLVTTWGRDFRADYWFLGDYVEKQRRSDRYYPILCLTATAVYLGNDDVVFETVSSLNLRNYKLYLGNVRRDDLLFNNVYFAKNEVNGSNDEFKLSKTVERIEQFYNKKIKSIIYCPYTSQVEEIYNALPDHIKHSVGKYYGSLDKYEKEHSYENFREGKYVTMICTKAFGMGVDISNIEIVYHYAPTGNLADYVQEIGRAARKEGLQGVAMTDFTDKDMKYIRMLHGLSNIKHYQLKEMISKIYNIHKEKNSRNFLISTDAFSYLFANDDIENKVKNGLLLISKDLEEKSSFPVLIVRPKSMFTKNFINVPNEIEEQFLHEFGAFAKKVNNIRPRIIPTSNNRASDTLVYNTGIIYEMNMSQLWEQRFNELTFPQFKWKFFNGELMKYEDNHVISPRVNIVIHYEQGFAEVSEMLKNNIKVISSIMARLKSSGQFFTKMQFREAFNKSLTENNKNKELSNLILDSFVADPGRNIGFNQNSDPLKFIQARKAQGRDETEFRIMNSNYTKLLPYFTRLLAQSTPNMNDTTFCTYIPLGRGSKQHDMIQLAIFLELFSLASYEVIGGRNMEIFLRVNDPAKLRKISEGNYRNAILTDIEKKRKRSEKILANFLKANFSDQERWDIIEDYFLGREESVSHAIGIDIEDLQTI